MHCRILTSVPPHLYIHKIRLSSEAQKILLPKKKYLGYFDDEKKGSFLTNFNEKKNLGHAKGPTKKFGIDTKFNVVYEI